MAYTCSVHFEKSGSVAVPDVLRAAGYEVKTEPFTLPAGHKTIQHHCGKDSHSFVINVCPLPDDEVFFWLFFMGPHSSGKIMSEAAKILLEHGATDSAVYDAQRKKRLSA